MVLICLIILIICVFGFANWATHLSMSKNEDCLMGWGKF
jgi:hypothetical protein